MPDSRDKANAKKRRKAKDRPTKAKKPKQARRAGTPTGWRIEFYETAKGRRPGREFLEMLGDDDKHKTPRQELLKIVRAVVDHGPLQFPTGKLGWHVMHKPKAKGEVDMSGICEARDKHGQVLYRLFCVLDRDAPDHGLEAPALVILDGATKQVRTAMSQKIYGRVDRHRKDYWATRRVAN